MGNSFINYLKIDFKRLLTDKKVLMTILLLLFIAVVDPLTVAHYFSNDVQAAQTIGQNPFHFWMLMNSVSWGNSIYNTAFWIITVLFTGLIYHEDKNTSIYMYQITRGGKKRYFISKFVSTGMLSFLTVIVILEINVLMTYTLFPDTIHKTEQYNFLIPLAENFVYDAFSVNPMYMVQIYTLLNALAISIFVIFSLSISMLLNIKNKYIVLIMPVIILYAISYITNSFPGLLAYDIRIILQPQAAAGIPGIDWTTVISVTGGWIIVNLILITTVFFKVRNCYE